MELLELITNKIKTNNKKIRILFPEGDNEKVQAVAQRLKGLTNNALEKEIANYVEPVLLFMESATVPTNLVKDNIEVIKISSEAISQLAQGLFELRKAKGMTQEEAVKLVGQTNYYGMMLLKNRQVDGFVGGITYTTADILRPALQVIQPKPGIKTVSSSFLMNKGHENFVFSDGSINLDPTADQLVDISVSALEFARLFELNPLNLALLSYSTNGSGKGPDVDKVKQACETLKTLSLGNVAIAGEIQFDAAWDENVRSKKFPGLEMKGSANVFIFPDLNAANIGYKIAQRLGGYNAIGPVVLGLNQPVNDLSRGATVEDIYYTALITALQTLT